MLHPTAFVLYGDVDFPLSEEKISLLKAGYICKYMDAEEYGYSEEEIAQVGFELFHKGLGDKHAFDEKAKSHSVVIRTNGDIIRVETGEIVGKMLTI